MTGARPAGTSPLLDPRAEALHEFLRARRARLTPADVGLPVRAHRRARGLRREDVAELAQISLSWYGQFERGRTSGVSTGTVESIGRVLQLTPAERAYLRDLAGITMPPNGASEAPASAARRIVRDTVEAAGAIPAHAFDAYYDVIAANRASRRIFGLHPGENILRRIFIDTTSRAVFVDWERAAEAIVASLRTRFARRAHDDAFLALLAELRDTSPSFARLWARTDVRSAFGAQVLVASGEGAVLALRWAVFSSDADGSIVAVFCVPEDPQSAARLHALAERDA